MDLTGNWKGYYVQAAYAGVQVEDTPDCRHPIEAKFEQIGSSIKGTMTDIQVLRVTNLSEMMALMPDGREKEGWRSFLERYPNVSHQVEFPRDSSLDGLCKGLEIRFTKTYRGAIRSILSFGGTSRVTNSKGTITYFGAVSEDGQRITGQYVTTRNRFAPMYRVRNPFVLERITAE